MTRERRHDLYWLGYRHGRRLAEHDPGTNHLPALRLGLILSGLRGRPFALGELRGYRQAADLPQPLYGHQITL